MKYALSFLFIAAGLWVWLLRPQQNTVPSHAASPYTIAFTGKEKKIGDIAIPEGFTRAAMAPGSFGAWLREVPLKADKTVYLYNGVKKANQEAQYAVLDIPLGHKDLQQCADAVMRLYAEYQYAGHHYSTVTFLATDGSPMDYASWMKGYRFSESHNKLQKTLTAAPCEGRACFEQYLETVFSYAGTLSLSEQLHPVTNPNDIKAGDVFIKGGSPGHAVIVADIIQNPDSGETAFLLAQSYMPAQDIHILQNPSSPSRLSPWYVANPTGKLLTPEWIFYKGALKSF